MKFNVLTLFPEMFGDFMNTSIIGKAVLNQRIEIALTNIRDFSKNKHKKVDDYPYGGGAGMVMCYQPLKDALASIEKKANERIIYFSPRGERLTQSKLKELSHYDQITLICGHYEGVDQRFIDTYVHEEISIGDYILTGGELPAMILIDGVSRMVESVLQNVDSHEEESFSSGLLEYPHYTRPANVDGLEVPSVLLSGNHAEIESWRLIKSIEVTKERRPDLYEAYAKKVL